MTLALGVSGRWPAEAKAESEPVAEQGGDADGEAHSRPDPRSARRRDANWPSGRSRGVAIFATPRQVAPTAAAPETRRPLTPRRVAPDDDEHANG